MAQLLHPRPQQLEAFANGNLSPEDVEAVAKHVEQCADCCHKLQQVNTDTFVDKIRKSNENTSLVGISGDFTPLPDSQPLKRTAIIPPELTNHARYRILNVLGEGGMGVVYKAEHRLMERMVALKVINKRYTANAIAVERFRREVKAAAKLSHPNIVSAFDAEQAGSLHFLVMEFVDGLSLDRLVRQSGPLPIVTATRFVTQAASGLQHAHQQGMIHRDIKPHNLMRTPEDKIKILDFGLARIIVDESYGEKPSAQLRITSEDTVIGTPDYLSPEQARSSRTVDIRSDIYSLGCTFYFLLTGRPPFVGDTPMEKLIMHCESEPMPVQQLRPEVPDELAAILHKMLAKQPSDRPQTPLELIQALAAFMRSHQTVSDNATVSAAVPVAGPQPEPIMGTTTVTQKRNNSFLVPGLALAFVLLLCGIAGWYFASNGTTPPDDGKDKVANEAKGSKTNPAANPGHSAPKKVLYVLPQTGLWYSDYAPIRKSLEQAGVEVVTASTALTPCRLFKDKKNVGQPVQPDVLLQNVQPDDYAGIIFCGANTDTFVEENPGSTEVKRLVSAMLKKKQAVCSICLGQRILGKLGYLQDLKVPACDYIEEEEQRSYNAKLDYDSTVVVNGSIILAGNDRDSEAFAQTIVAAIR